MKKTIFYLLTLVLLTTAFQLKAQPPSCFDCKLVSSLDISTGVDHPNAGLYPLNTLDDFWFLTQSPNGLVPNGCFVKRTSGNSIGPNTGNNAPPSTHLTICPTFDSRNGNLNYLIERSFRICQNASNPCLNAIINFSGLSFNHDGSDAGLRRVRLFRRTGTVSTQVWATPTFCMAPAISTAIPFLPTASVLAPGQYILEFELINNGTGLTVPGPPNYNRTAMGVEITGNLVCNGFLGGGGANCALANPNNRNVFVDNRYYGRNTICGAPAYTNCQIADVPVLNGPKCVGVNQTSQYTITPFCSTATYSCSSPGAVINMDKITLGPGTHTITVDYPGLGLTGCTFEHTVDLAPALTLTATGCMAPNDNSGTVTASVSPSGFYNYSISPIPASASTTSGTNLFSGRTSGLYTVTVDDGQGCQFSDQISIASTDMTLTLTTPGASCQGTTIKALAKSSNTNLVYEYALIGSNNMPIPRTNIPNNASNPLWDKYDIFGPFGIYTGPIKIRARATPNNPNNNCFIEQTIIIHPNPNAQITQDFACAPAILTATPVGLQYQWGTSAGPGTYTSNNTLSTGDLYCGESYTVTAVDANGCTAMSWTNVGLNKVDLVCPDAPCVAPNSSFALTANPGGCMGTTYVFDGPIGPGQATPSTANGNYQFLNPSSAPNEAGVTGPVGPVSGTYSVTVTDGQGCSAISTLDISTGADVSITANGSVCHPATLEAIIAPGTGIPPFTYTWTSSNSSLPLFTSSTTNMYTPPNSPQQDVTYTVSVTDAGPCTNTATFTLKSEAFCCLTSNLSWQGTLSYSGYTYIPHNSIASNSIPTFIGPGADVFVEGNLTLDQNLTLDNCNVFFGPDAQITLTNGVTLEITNTSTLQSACGRTWKGIYNTNPAGNSIVRINDNCTIRHMEIGVCSDYNNLLTIKDNTFEDNQNSIWIKRQSTANIEIQNNIFTSSPNTTKPDHGIILENCKSVEIGMGSSGNTFDKLYNGVYIIPTDNEQQEYALIGNKFINIYDVAGAQELDIYTNRFSQWKGTGVYTVATNNRLNKLLTITGDDNVYTSFQNCEKCVTVNGINSNIELTTIEKSFLGIGVKDANNTAHQFVDITDVTTKPTLFELINVAGDANSIFVRECNTDIEYGLREDPISMANNNSYIWPTGIQVNYPAAFASGTLAIRENKIASHSLGGDIIKVSNAGPNTTITSNRTFFKKPDNTTNINGQSHQVGINVKTSLRCTIEDNVLRGADNFVDQLGFPGLFDWNSSAIMLDNSPDAKVSCNFMDNTLFGLHVLGECITGDQNITQNRFHDHYYPIYLQDDPITGTLGTLGNIGSPNYNPNNEFHAGFNGMSPHNPLRYKIYRESQGMPHPYKYYVEPGNQNNVFSHESESSLGQPILKYEVINGPQSMVFTCTYESSAGNNFDKERPNPEDSGIDKHTFKEYPFIIFPNPTTGNVTLNYESDKDGKFVILDLSGKVVESVTLSNQHKEKSISLNLASGIYVWRYTIGNLKVKEGKLSIQ